MAFWGASLIGPCLSFSFLPGRLSFLIVLGLIGLITSRLPSRRAFSVMRFLVGKEQLGGRLWR